MTSDSNDQTGTNRGGMGSGRVGGLQRAGISVSAWSGRTGRLLSTFTVTIAVLLMSAGCGSAAPQAASSPSPDPTAVTVTHDLPYGSNRTLSGSSVTLTVDVYAPPGASGDRRPVIILLPGGGFRTGSTDKSQLSGLATAIASQGLVVACIDYRTYGAAGSMSDTVVRTLIVQGMQDAKAAVRFFRKDRATSDRFRVDRGRIFLGGHSAGGVNSGAATYLDRLSKADAQLRRIIRTSGGLEGQSGNSGYSSSVSGWINLAGGLEKKTWVTSTSRPMMGVYGTNDTIVPPGESSALGGALSFSGARSLYERAVKLGITRSRLYVIEGGDHYSPVDGSNSALVSRIVQFVNSIR